MKPSNFLRQIKEITEVTSAAPGHKLEDIDAINLQTPPRNRLLLPFSSKVILSDSSEVNEIEPSPNQFLKEDFIQPYEEASPSLGKEISYLQDCILANLAKKKEVEESFDQPPKANYMQPCEKGLPHSAKKRSLSPLPKNDILAKISKLEKPSGQSSKAKSIQTCEKVLPNPARNSLLNPNSNDSSDDSEDSDENEVEILVLDMFVMKSNEVALRNDDTASSSSESGFYTQ